ncbi:Tyrosinase ustQ [Colletotrichum sp. SAR11_57]|nr:Tyrosinase ustQ [Colletotrichum sp. SAR11_57]
MNKFLTKAIIALGASEAVRAACTNPSVRKSWSALTDGEKTSYISSTLCLMDAAQAPAKTGYAGSTTVWEELQAAHVSQAQFVHSVGAFLPWHRWYMTVQETLLRNECGYTGPMPRYWDEQAEQAEGPLESASILNGSATAGFGSTTLDENGCVTDGPYTNVRLTLDTELNRVEPVCLSRLFKQNQYEQTAQKIIDACLALDNYVDFNNCLGASPHTGGHYAIGGTMDDPSLSPGDPLFFLHHTNLDRIWWQWQAQNESRLTDIGGNNVAEGFFWSSVQPSSLGVNAFLPYFNDNGNTTTLDHVLWMAGIAENITIAEVMDVNSDAICIEYQ